jgi:prepilin-type N-terminal cleavage/methylation domain-containing protein
LIETASNRGKTGQMKRVRDLLHPEQRARSSDLVQRDANSSSSLASEIRLTKVPQIRRSAAGFTLIEMAVAVFILALLLGSILVPLQTQIESRKTDETQRILDQAREALIGFAAATGRFPCPARASSDGTESFFSPGGSPTNGLCHSSVTGAAGMNLYVGFLPAVTLGFTPIDATGYALDAWGIAQNRIRYAVSFQTVTVTRPFTTAPNPPTNTTGMRAAGMANIQGAALLNVCSTAAGASGTSCAAGATLTSNAIAVIWSLGPNAATSGGVSADEARNAQAFTSADRVFVMRTKSGVTASEFDDIVTWITPPALFNRLIAAGQLP